MKTLLISVYLLLFVTNILPQDSLINIKTDLVGTWERFGDEFEGAQIKVFKVNTSFRAILTEVPESMKSYCFEIGDLKWKDVKQLSDNYYELLDLTRNCFNANHYNEVYLIFNREDEILIRNLSLKSEVGVGNAQKWKKLTK